MPPWGGWAPPAPQPGVIPLRPLRTGEVLGGAFTAFRRHWKPLTGAVLLVQGIGILLVAAAIGLAAIGVRNEFAAVFDLPAGETPAAGDVAALLLWLAPVVVLFTVTMVLLTAMIGALCPAVIQEAVLGRPVTFSALWRRCWSRLPAVLGVVLCVGLLTGGPLLLLYAACVLPALTAVAHDAAPPVGVFLLPVGMLLWMPFAVWLTVRFSLAPAVAVCEGLGPVAAMRRSSRLVEGAWWRTCGIGALAYLLAAVVGSVVQLPFTFIGLFALIPAVTATGDAAQPSTLVFGLMGYMACVLLGSVIGSVLQLGYSQLVLALLYVDQRMRKENLAQALIASAADSAAPAPPGA
ncbi:hypothetical protein WDV06_32020 [Streptomyces racemochromogenes]|uniref:Glycerophosphoryl diester phosphodiesterase membrane domain-containing protein n=1 Tax=Streptomyces racemochromogenes TaxID=67353 RepID=A0ABW7PMP6_9ACTN